MDSTSDLPLEETRLWLKDYAERRFAPVPGELIAAHIIAVTEGADFPVRRAAMEALHRRMQNIESDGLFVKQRPERTALGQYTIARPMNGNGTTRKRHEPRPFRFKSLVLQQRRDFDNCVDVIRGTRSLYSRICH